MTDTLIDDDSSFPTSVVVPSGSDPRTAASVKAPFQTLANRAAYLRKVLETLGVIRLREAADLGALAGIDDDALAAGELRYVPGFGVYKLVVATGDSAPWYVEALSGARRWEHELLNVKGATYGLATLSASGRVVEKPSNAIVARGSARGAPAQSTNSTTGVDVTDSSFTLDGAIANDIVEVEASVVGSTDGSSNGNISIAIVDGATTDHELSTSYGGSVLLSSGTSSQGLSLVKTRTVLTGGTITVKLMADNISGGAHTTTISRFTIKARLVRP